MSKNNWIVWGSELSPFYLKVIATMRYLDLPLQCQPTDGNMLSNAKTYLQVTAIQQGLSQLTWPPISELDELPLVPYMFSPTGDKFYDSSEFAYWLDKYSNMDKPSLLGEEDPAIAFVIALIDDYADEVGLYMTHHMRWKFSAGNNSAGKSLGNEFRHLLKFGLKNQMAKAFPARQVRRLPYLFSVAPQNYQVESLKRSLQPPAHEDFPPTHDLIEIAFNHLLAALENILKEQPYVLGPRFTLADASIYGQVGAHLLNDHTAADHIKSTAPKTYEWLSKIQQGNFSASDHEKTLKLNDSITPLLAEINRVYIPLMKQNEKAYESFVKQGITEFNEAAFNKNSAIYSGAIDGIPFKSVAKTFQVKSWRIIKEKWNSLSESNQQKVLGFAPLDLTAPTSAETV